MKQSFCLSILTKLSIYSKNIFQTVENNIRNLAKVLETDLHIWAGVGNKTLKLVNEELGRYVEILLNDGEVINYPVLELMWKVCTLL